MQRALAALEANIFGTRNWLEKTGEAIIALRERLAQPEDEPHSWYSAEHDEWMTNKTRKEHEKLNSYTHKVGGFDLPLYTRPQPAAQWQGLTFDDQTECLQAGWVDGWMGVMNATEAKLKEKNT